MGETPRDNTWSNFYIKKKRAEKTGVKRNQYNKGFVICITHQESPSLIFNGCGVKRSASRTLVNNAWSYDSTSHVCLHGVNKFNFTFTLHGGSRGDSYVRTCPRAWDCCSVRQTGNNDLFCILWHEQVIGILQPLRVHLHEIVQLFCVSSCVTHALRTE